MSAHPASPLLPFLFFFLLHLALRSAEFSVTNTSIPHCKSVNCGDDVEIRYPLWYYDESDTSHCGYPNLGVVCEGDQPVLKLGEDRYRVANVSNNTIDITLQDLDLLSSDCSIPRHNLTLELEYGFRLLYTAGVDAYLFFFVNCSRSIIEGGYEIPCLGREDGKSSYVSYGYVPIPRSNDWWDVCDELFVAPVLETLLELNRSNLPSSFAYILRGGFQLTWPQPEGSNCWSCEKTGGKCGYASNGDVGRYDFQCFCNNGTFGWDCSGEAIVAATSKTRNIVVGVCVGVAGFFLLSFFAFLLYRNKMKAPSGSSTLLFRTASSDPSTKKDPEMGSTHYQTHVFKYEELHEATNGFSDNNELGDGGFGTVYLGKLRDGRIVAVKRLYENNYKRVEQFLNEVAILNCLRHQNLVTLYGCTSRHSRELLLVYEYVPNGTVADHLHGNRASEGSLNWPVRMGIAIETATALAYLHAVEPQIIHRDVKTNNILLDNNFHVKVADFGLSRLFPMDVTHVSTAPQGTPGYVDPEYHQCYQLTEKSDVYSFGVVLVELVSSKPAVDITRHRHEINLANMAINKIQNGALQELVDPALGFETDWEVRRMIKLVAELAFRCLQGEKEMRPSMEEVRMVLQGIQDCQDRADMVGDVDHGTADDMSLLKNNTPLSPHSVMDKWTSRTTTPNASG